MNLFFGTREKAGKRFEALKVGLRRVRVECADGSWALCEYMADTWFTASGYMTFAPEWLTGSPNLDTSNWMYL